MSVYFLIKIHLQPNHCLIILAEETINAISNALSQDLLIRFALDAFRFYRMGIITNFY